MVDCLDVLNRVEVKDRDEVQYLAEQSRPKAETGRPSTGPPWREGLLLGGDAAGTDVLGVRWGGTGVYPGRVHRTSPSGLDPVYPVYDLVSDLVLDSVIYWSDRLTRLIVPNN